MKNEPVTKLHASGKSKILAASCQNLQTGSAGGCEDTRRSDGPSQCKAGELKRTGGEDILEKVEKPPTGQGTPKGRFSAAMSFATGSYIIILTLLGISSLSASLTVTSVSPSTGAMDQGEAVSIKGTGFTSVQDVYFGSVKSPNYQILSDTEMTAIAPIPSGPAGLVHVIVSDGTETSFISYLNRYVFTRGKWLAYLTHGACNLVGSIIPFSLAEGISPPSAVPIDGSTTCLAITPNNATLYASVSNSPSDHRIVVFDIPRNLVSDEIPFSQMPVDIVISPSGLVGYVISGQQLSQIDLTTNQIVSQLPLSFDASQLAITPDGLKAFISHHADNRISVVDLASNLKIQTISIKKPFAMGIEPTGKHIYVTTGMENCYALDIKTGAVVKKFRVGNYPCSVAVNPNGNEVYVCNFSDNTVSVIQIQKGKRNTTREIPVGAGPVSIAISPDGNTGYVNNGLDGTMTSIDLNTHTVLSNDSIDPALFGIAITPDQCPIAIFHAVNLDGFLTFAFDGSSSITPVGEITTYIWNFEGYPITTTSPFISYEFGTPGVFPVTLTVINSAGTSTKPVFTGKTMNRNGGYLAQAAGMVIIPWPTPPGSQELSDHLGD